MARIVYRIVLENPPSDRDLKSYQELGISIERNDPDALRMASGLSVYATLAYARRAAKRFPWKGKCFIAEIALSDSDEAVVEQTGSNPRHYTLWCNEQIIRVAITRIVPVKVEIGDV